MKTNLILAAPYMVLGFVTALILWAILAIALWRSHRREVRRQRALRNAVEFAKAKRNKYEKLP